VGVCAAEALWKVSPETCRAILALAARLGDPEVGQAAAQALYRIGPAAKEAVPALIAAAKAKDTAQELKTLIEAKLAGQPAEAVAPPRTILSLLDALIWSAIGFKCDAT
jgi:hypothetical protein